MILKVLRWHGLFDHLQRMVINESCTSQDLLANRLFGWIADTHELFGDQAEEPLGEIFEREACEARG